VHYIEIAAKCEEVDENSYTIESTGEVVTKIQLSLVVPTMRDRILCEIPIDQAPTTDQLSKWELDETWLMVSADGMRALAFERSNVRAGEKAVGSLVIFQAVAVREVTSDERKQLQEARKTQKLAAKQRRAQRQAEKKAQKDSEKTAKVAKSA
jgi:hypothetical protein